MDVKLPVAVRFAVAGSIALASGMEGPAQANLVMPVTVSLFSPGGVTSDGVTITPFAGPLVDIVGSGGISVGDGSNIGGFMLPGESILFSGNSILLHVAAGAALASGDLMTGYLGLGAEHARYMFDNLAVAGETIVGANIQPLAGVLSGTGGVLAGPGSVGFFLDDLKFIDPGTGSGNAFGDFRIDLVLQPVPEPAGWVLALLGLTTLRFVIRRRAD